MNEQELKLELARIMVRNLEHYHPADAIKAMDDVYQWIMVARIPVKPDKEPT